jgi:5'-nucleotidase
MAVKNHLPQGMVLNVNVPENCETLDFEIVKTGKRDYGEPHEERIDPKGKPYFWVGGNLFDFEDIPESDCNTITSGKISVTPLHIDMTSHRFMEEMKGWSW